jgi:Domain of unknown function (DUF3576)
MMRRNNLSARWALGASLALLLLALGACEGTNVNSQYPERRDGRTVPAPSSERDTVFGPGGFSFFNLGDTGKKKQQTDGTGGVAVNSFLWRASLDTMSFMPLASADPFGGVIITDWYSPPETPNERFKATVYILERELRANGVRVALFRQSRNGSDWQDVATSQETAVSLENAILTRARQLRVSAVNRE